MVIHWAHLLLCNPKQIYTIGFTMHNTNSLTFTQYVKNIHSSTRLEFDWLQWVAPDTACTISVLSMTYSTSVSLVRAGKGVFFVYFSFSFWVHLAQLKHPLTLLESWLIPWVQNQRPPTFIFGPQAVPALLFYFSGHVPSFLFCFSQLTSNPAPAHTSSPTPSLPYQPPVPGSPTDDTDLHVLHHLLCLCPEGSGNGRTDRTTQGHTRRGLGRLQEGNWHKERISLELAKEPLLPEPVLSPLTGILVLVTPIEMV